MGNTIDAVVPLVEKDFERFLILKASLDRNFKDLGRCFVVVPERSVNKAREYVDDVRYVVLSEEEVVPEFRYFKKMPGIFRRMPRNLKKWPDWYKAQLPGWYKQQMIKLAISDFVDSEFYLTLDADVICVKEVSFPDLVKEGKVMSRRTRRDLHPEWYKWAERILGVKRSGWTHGVTPALLSTEAMSELKEYVARRDPVVFKALARITPSRMAISSYFTGWRSCLLRQIPWTEYALYNTFLEATGSFDKYHFDGGEYSIYSHSVWNAEDFEKWDPADSFSGEGNFFFIVIQSTSGASVEDVKVKLHAYIDLNL